MTRDGPATATASQVVLAFVAVYVIWGSTYLAIRWAEEGGLPPFLMAGARFVIAAALMFAWARRQGAALPAAADVRLGVVTGMMMLTAGNGTVVWSEQFVPSGRVALVVATVPVWMVLVDWARPGGHRPSALELAGLAIGLGGVAYLIGPEALALGQGDARLLLGEVAALAGSASWGIGSLVARYGTGHATPAMRTTLQMATAGVVLSTVALLHGDWRSFDPAAVTAKAWWSFAYLVTFGSLIGFSAYVWLLRVVSPAKASTYAYVNPAVAVFLGWLLAGEPLTLRMLWASAIIIAGVALVTVAKALPMPSAKARA